MKECDILLRKSKHTLTAPTYFQGSRPFQPQDLHPETLHAVYIVAYVEYHIWLHHHPFSNSGI